MKKITSDKRIHVFYFIHDLTPFGAQRVALYTVKNLDKNKFSVTICSFWGEETLAAQFLKCEAEVIFLRARRYLDPSAWIRLVRFLFRMRPDIIQTNLPELSFPVRLMSIFLPRMQIIHVFHNPFSSEPIYWRFLNIMTLRLCDAVVFVSKGIIQEVAIKTPWLKSRFFVVQNGVEIDADSVADSYRMRGELGIEADEKAICCVGRLVTQKGQDILIKAVAKLVKEKRRIKLVLAGDGEMLQELKDMALQLGIADKTLFLGRSE
ncbi:MAG: glycosyltransferase [Elusimicrobia bacterium]|nr:glycosyltransferase [Elusimicrobiota bacterium]